MNYKRWLFTGIALLVGSILIGILGTFLGVYSSFDALEQAENAGIGPVGAGIQNALIFTVVGVIGSAVGTALIAVGGVKAYKTSKENSISE